MNPTHAAVIPTIAWGRGDLYTLFVAVIVFAIGCFVHRAAIKAKGFDSVDMLGGLMASGLTVGPLLMIIADPFTKYLGLFEGIDLLTTVMNEARVTLWFACFLALVNTTLAFLRPRPA